MPEDIQQRVREDYSRVAEAAAGSMRYPVAERLYSPADLEGLPAAALELALGLGNPVAAAALEEGEVVLDLGCGGGIDTFLAARRVGPSGKVIGLDLTPGMIQLARDSARAAGVANVEFILGEMEDLSRLRTASIDAVISNGVVNLSPDKDRVFAEVHRVLKPGRRAVFCDMVVNGEVPAGVLENPAAWSG